jgi:GntR family transcriptional repressor for pyruvate dehydrogenase complex
MQKKDSNKSKLGYHVALDIYLSIKNGVYPLESWLPAENRLVLKYGVGRNTVREALHLLNVGGFILTTHGSGSQVISTIGNLLNPIFEDEIVSKQQLLLDLYDYRKSIEVEAAGKAALRRSDADIAQMRQNLIDLEATIERGENFAQCGFAFHKLISVASNTGFALNLLQNIQNQILEVMDRLALTVYAAEETLNYHKNLYNVIQSGNAEKARKAMTDDMNNAREQLVWAINHEPKVMLLGEWINVNRPA